MGKKQHSKDRLYLTTKEWKTEGGGYKDKSAAPFQRLPFNCCAISFTPFEDPVCTEDGTVFDIVNIVPYVQRHKKHPVTGQPLQLSDLIRLHFHKNADSEFHCPVLNKVFTEHTHIVAVRTSGNVYCYEAIQELNIKPKFLRDLLSDEPFTRKDVIHIQDPMNVQGRVVENFSHVKEGLSVADEEEAQSQKADGATVRTANEDVQRALKAMGSASNGLKEDRHTKAVRALAEAKARSAEATTSKKELGDQQDGDWRLRAPQQGRRLPSFKPGAVTWDTDDYIVGASEPKSQGNNKKQSEVVSKENREVLSPQRWYEGRVKFVASNHTTGDMARSFTSTVMPSATVNTREMVRLDRNPSKKGYVKVQTSKGDLNIELHCDIVPRTCENFLALCEMGYYVNTIFHRSIKNFMVQGGDPTGTGKGGDSIYGPTFKDELDSRLLHSGRGVLSMANSGANTNGSQFFILYKSAAHLNYKHTVFGRVVGGFETLTAMEQTSTDADDRPLEELKIMGTTIFTNPYKEMEDKEAQLVAEARAKEEEHHPDNERGTWYSNPGQQRVERADNEAVGRYLTLMKKQNVDSQEQNGDRLPRKKVKIAAKSELSNFDAW